jgi:hypothetical protein
MKFYIIDWAGNHIFPSLSWKSFEDAEQHLCEFFDAEGLDYEEDRQEYEITTAKPKLKFNYTEWMG